MHLALCSQLLHLFLLLDFGFQSGDPLLDVQLEFGNLEVRGRFDSRFFELEVHFLLKLLSLYGQFLLFELGFGLNFLLIRLEFFPLAIHNLGQGRMLLAKLLHLRLHLGGNRLLPALILGQLGVPFPQAIRNLLTDGVIETLKVEVPG